MIDIVTVVFEQELSVLKAQAQSIDLYCNPADIGTVQVVVNDSDLVVQMIDTAWWGQFSNRVQVIPRSKFSNTWCNNGWVSQQALKMVAAAAGTSVYSIILDAKTIFVRSVSLAQLIDTSGQIQTGQLEVYPVFEPSQQIVNKLFDIELTAQAGPGGVPFVVSNQVMRELIADVTAGTNQLFTEWFQDQGMLTEFLLYSGYVVKIAGSLDPMYTKHNNLGGIVNVCHSEVGSWDQKFTEMQQPETLTVSVHRNAWIQITTDQQQQYLNFLHKQGIKS